MKRLMVLAGIFLVCVTLHAQEAQVINFRPAASGKMDFISKTLFCQTAIPLPGKSPQHPGPFFVGYDPGEAGNLLVAIVPTKPDDPGTWLAWVDCDGDGDLDDERALPVFAGKVSDGSNTWLTPVVRPLVRVKQDDGSVIEYKNPLHLKIIGQLPRVQTPAQTYMPVIYLQVVQDRVMRVKVDINGKSTLVALMDENFDGYKCNASMNSGSTDIMLCDFNGDSKMSMEIGEYLPLGKHLIWKNDLQDITINPDGSKLTLTTYQGPKADLKIKSFDGKNQPVKTSILAFANDEEILFASNPGEKLSMLTGEFQFMYMLLLDPAGKIQATFTSDDELKLTEGTQDIVLGGPLLMKITPEADIAEKTLAINIVVETVSGHTLSGLGDITSQESSVPDVVVMDASGKVIASEKASFG